MCSLILVLQWQTCWLLDRYSTCGEYKPRFDFPYSLVLISRHIFVNYNKTIAKWTFLIISSCKWENFADSSILKVFNFITLAEAREQTMKKTTSSWEIFWFSWKQIYILDIRRKMQLVKLVNVRRYCMLLFETVWHKINPRHRVPHHYFKLWILPHVKNRFLPFTSGLQMYAIWQDYYFLCSWYFANKDTVRRYSCKRTFIPACRISG